MMPAPLRSCHLPEHWPTQCTPAPACAHCPTVTRRHSGSRSTQPCRAWLSWPVGRTRSECMSSHEQPRRQDICEGAQALVHISTDTCVSLPVRGKPQPMQSLMPPAQGAGGTELKVIKYGVGRSAACRHLPSSDCWKTALQYETPNLHFPDACPSCPSPNHPFLWL